MKKILSFFLALSFGLLSVSAQNKDPEFVKYMNSPWAALGVQVDDFKTANRPDDIRGAASEQPVDRRKGHAGRKGPERRRSSAFPEQTARSGRYYKRPAKHRQNTSADSHRRRVGTRHAPCRMWDDFPYQMALGSLKDNSLIYKMGLEVALPGETRRTAHKPGADGGCEQQFAQPGDWLPLFRRRS